MKHVRLWNSYLIKKKNAIAAILLEILWTLWTVPWSCSVKYVFLALIKVGFLGLHFGVWDWELLPYLKLLRIILETWHLVGTHTYLVSKNMPFSTRTTLLLPMSAFFAKSQYFFAKIVPLLKAIVWELC